MTIDPTTATAPATAGTPSAAKPDPLGKDAFMTLLVTQLQHQDPTQPKDDSQLLAQLAQFSSLERLTNIQQSVDKISQLLSFLETSIAAVSQQNAGTAVAPQTDTTTAS